MADEFTEIHERVPEHSLALMHAMSHGQPVKFGEYLFFHASDWLMAIGYPLKGRFDKNEFFNAVTEAAKNLHPASFFAIAPSMPDEFKPNIIESDRYYVLAANAPIPSKLKNPVAKAAQLLDVSITNEFSGGHRKLWREFTQSRNMNARVEGLYAQTPSAMRLAGNALVLLNASDKAGNLVASLLLDTSPKDFISYIIGAHSTTYAVPHATDLLFAHMLHLAREQGKRYIHLGLGVNTGILRFKRKWGAVASHEFKMAAWSAMPDKQPRESIGQILATAFLHTSSPSARQYLQAEPSQRPFAMLWELKKNGKTSWIAGTAHFFRHSFENSFRTLFRSVENVLFEGPLDPEFMNNVDMVGKRVPANYRPMLEELTEAEIRTLEKTIHGPTGRLARALGMSRPVSVDVRWLLANAMPWYAFFTLWTSFLEGQGWRQSVDMEAWRIAREMGKNVIGMENLHEQLESLESLPRERALNFFRSCSTWKKRARHNLSAYLSGDLERMMGSSAEFPTRTEHIVGRRDQRFRERMRPWLLKGNTAVFVGSAHMVNLRHMLAEDGFSVRQKPFGFWPRMHLHWRNLQRPDEKVTW